MVLDANQTWDLLLFDETARQAKVLTVFLAIAGEGLLCQENIINTSSLIICSLMPVSVRALLLSS